jgi:putative endonuclease
LIYQVYVLNNSAGQKYIGLSQDPQARLLQHNSGISRWTKGKVASRGADNF